MRRLLGVKTLQLVDELLRCAFWLRCRWSRLRGAAPFTLRRGTSQPPDDMHANELDGMTGTFFRRENVFDEKASIVPTQHTSRNRVRLKQFELDEILSSVSSDRDDNTQGSGGFPQPSANQIVKAAKIGFTQVAGVVHVAIMIEVVGDDEIPYDVGSEQEVRPGPLEGSDKNNTR